MQVILLDMKNVLYRQGYAHLELKDAEGRATGACYGFLKVLLRLKRKFGAAKFVAVWDAPGESWRHKMLVGYKKRDDPKPDAEKILKQIPIIQMLCVLMGIPAVGCAGVEADDLIGMLVSALRERGDEVVVYSSDKDFMQLMCEGVTLIRDVDKERKLGPDTAKDVRALFHCELKDVLKVRALCGDSSDKIPGVQAKVGPVTAAKMVQAGLKKEKFDKTVWRNICRNYQLMKLKRTWQDEAFTDQQQRTLGAAIPRVLSELDGKTAMNGRDYDALLEYLSVYQLSEAMEQRRALWAIQKRA